MKKLFSMFTAIILLLSATSINAWADGYDFNDIKGHWAEATIEKFKDKNIISGYPDGSFKPDNPITRAEFAKIITIAFDLQGTSDLTIYDDISQADWYYPYLEKSAKYIPVYPLPLVYETNNPYRENWEKKENGFLPDTYAIRMHVAEALVEIKKEKENINPELPSIQEINSDLEETFKDGEYEGLFVIHPPTVAENVRRMNEYTWLAKELDIMYGTDDGYFMPNARMSRAEIVTSIERLLNN